MKPISKQIEIKSGFFPSIAYIPVPSTLSQESYVKCIASLLTEHKIDHKPIEDLHISLTKTFHPLENEIKNIVHKVQQSINSK